MCPDKIIRVQFQEMKKQCQECNRVLDSSSFNGSSKEPDGLAKKCSACVNRRRRQLHASKTGDRKPAHIGTLVKKGDCGLLGEKGMTALHYACRSELGKVNRAYADRLVLCAELLLGQKPARLDRTLSPLDLCAARGGSVKIAQLLMAHGWQPTIGTVLTALGHGQRHGQGNYDIAALCLESGVDINEKLGSRTLLHAFAHQGDIVGTRWLADKGAKRST